MGTEDGQGGELNRGAACARQRTPQVVRIEPYRPAWLFGTNRPATGLAGATGGATAGSSEVPAGEVSPSGAEVRPGPMAAGWTRADLLRLIAELEAVLQELRSRVVDR